MSGQAAGFPKSLRAHQVTIRIVTGGDASMKGIIAHQRNSNPQAITTAITIRAAVRDHCAMSQAPGIGYVA